MRKEKILSIWKLATTAAIISSLSSPLALSQETATQPSDAGDLGESFEENVREMFDTNPNAKPDLEIQLTKKASRDMMIRILADLQFMTSIPNCRDTIDLIFNTNRIEGLHLIGNNQVYSGNYQEQYNQEISTRTQGMVKRINVSSLRL